MAHIFLSDESRSGHVRDGDRGESSLTFKSDETIWGRVRQADESIQYRGILKVEKSGRVSLELSFVPPHPFIVNMPENHRIEAQSITES